MTRPTIASSLSFMAAVLLSGSVFAQDPAQLQQRVEKLEEQLVDMHAMIGTLESLAQQGGSAAVATPSAAGGAFGSGYDGAGGGGGTSSVSELEIQVRALSSQMSELLQRMSRLEARFGAAPSTERHGDGGIPASGSGVTGNQYALGEAQRDRLNDGVSGLPAPGAGAGGFGSLSVEPGASQQGGQDHGFSADAGGGVQVAQASSAAARAAYEQAYNHMVQRQYRLASEGFQQFLSDHPNDGLAGQAQFWLGEAAFVSGEYRQAADHFLKGFTAYPNSEKAPESLLKLAISLKRLNEGGAACDALAELDRRFPNAPEAVRQRAETEKRRTAC